jgi:DNA-binding response OmpR family regulator
MKRVRVLLVDDDVELCSSLTRLLGMDGFTVTAVHDAESGAREGLNGDYEIVILDVMLPGGDGRKVLRRIRMRSQVPVIMLTARGDEDDRIRGLEGGADDYLAKPFNARELVARIRAARVRFDGHARFNALAPAAAHALYGAAHREGLEPHGRAEDTNQIRPRSGTSRDPVAGAQIRAAERSTACEGRV